MIGTNDVRQSLVLLYKGFLIRKRHYIVTIIFEIVLPVFIASIPAIIQSELHASDYADDFQGPQQMNVSTFPPFEPFEFKGYVRKDLKVEFVYAPSNEVSQKLMTAAVSLWDQKANTSFNITLKGVDSENEMETYCLYKLRSSRRQIMIGTVFQNFISKEGQLPSSLEYTIRYGDSDRFGDLTFYTENKYRVNGPQKYNAYTDTYFLGWQAAVQETFIHQKMQEKGIKDIRYKMLLQRFPYPAYIQLSSAFHGVRAVSVFMGFGFLIYILNLMSRVVGEKAKGSKELLKMMGMTDNLYWTSTFLNYFGLVALDLLIIIIIYKCPLKKSLIFMVHTNGFLLIILLLLFGATLVLFCLAFSTFFNRATIAIVAILLAYEVPLALLSSYYFSHDTTNYSLLPKVSKLGICLLPPGALLTMFLIITFYESTGEGARWSNIAEYGAIHDMNMLTVIEMMVISCFIYTVIIWYVDAVWPWQFGIPKPLDFPFTKNYWCNAKPKDTDELELVERELNSEFFEDEPSGVSPGIVTCNISKEFRTGFQKRLVVKNVSLNMYRGHITALLGHNGAGKTTFINILTGLCTPSSGSASINGFNILTQTSEARSSLGVCPQHNILYDDLTVEEHLKIFAALKGIRWSDLSDEISHILNVLYLTEKRNELAKTLSGGMKRKLCLGIAIIGGSKVLFLDEPTSGMDVEARRNVWDALLDLRHDRTIILTTHYMEEADILGDRVAIMAEGEIQCCGSPMFLKKKFGTGYHLHLVKNEDFDLDKITEMLEKHKPQSVVEMNTENEVTFNLSTGTDSSYGNLFKDLEDHKVELGVDSFGVTVTTMDDVFLNVANISDLKLKLQANNSIQNEIVLEVEDVYDEGKKPQISVKFGVQLFGLLTKRFHYAKRNLLILISQILLPFLIMLFCFYIISLGSDQSVESFPALKLDIQSVYGQTIGFYQTNEDQITAGLKNIFDENSVSAKEIDDPNKFILEYSSTDFSVYSKKLLVGGTVEKLDNGTFILTAWYNGEPYHVAPMSLLLLHITLLRFIMDSGSITLINAPLPSSQQYSYDELRMHERLMANVFVPLALTYISAAFVFLPTHERTSKAKLLQLMTGISAPLYWASMFLWDFLVLSVACLVFIIPFAMFTPYAFFFSHSEAIGTSVLMILLYGWASIPFSYLFSFLCKKGVTGYSILEAIGILCGSFAAAVLSSIQLLSRGTPTVDLLIWIFRIFPPFCASSGFSKLFAIAYNNAFCESISQNDLDFSCSSDSMTEKSSLFKCCKDLCGKNCLQQTDLITWDVHACGRDMLMLYVDGIVFSLIVCFLETVTARKLMVYIKQHLPRRKKIIQDQEALSNVPKDSDVIAEEERIRSMGSDAVANEALVVSDLTKMFKAFCAVDHLTFSIHQEECFGLLGVNGAGKTTTFRMLTGDCIPSDGNAFVKEYSLKENLEEFQAFIGYCPQFDALIDRLTGREMLELFAYLRGLSGKEIVEAVNMVIKLTDLSEHADKQTQFYSGGTKRKLSIGIALVGSPPLIFLDEPTAGVDPVSRRKIWAALSQARTKTGAAVILTTHSMEECEALCSRLAIMVNGRFRCLGSIQHLKSKYGKGYTLVIKMKKETQGNPQTVTEIKAFVESNLQSAELKDDHQGMLQYHIVDPTVTLSYLFNFMDDMKSRFNLEDYLISDTSLEQIFLTFARAQRLFEQSSA